MAKRQREWAKRARLALIESLGGKCVDCGTTKDLELDHIEPCTWDRDKMDYYERGRGRTKAVG